MNYNYQKRFVQLSSCIFAVYFSACGPRDPKIQEQERSVVKLPEFAEASQIYSFLHKDAHLRSDLSKDFFEGTLILWKDEAAKEKLADVLESARQTREDKAYIAATKKAIAIEKAALDKDVDNKLRALNNDLRQKESDLANLKNSPEYRKQQMEEMDFYRKQSPQLLADNQAWLDKNKTSTSDEAFQDYCDVRLLEFAISSILRNQSFTERPKVLGICEGYFASRNLFQGTSCATEQTGRGNYFQCIWENGILKTFSLLKKNGSKADNDEQNEFISKLDELKTWITAQTNLNREVFTLKRVGTQFKIELDRSGAKKRLVKIHNDGPTSFLQDETSVVFLKTLTKERTSGTHTYSFHDILFNTHILTELDSIPTMGESDKAEFGTQIRQLDVLFGQQSPNMKADRDLQKQLISDIQKIKNQIVIESERKNASSPRSPELKNAQEKLLTTEQKTAAMLKGENLAHLVLKSQVTFESIDDTLIAVTVNLNSGANHDKDLRGCFNKSTGANQRCPSSHAIGSPAELSFNQNSGLLTVRSVLQNAVELGCRFNDGDADFQLIPEVALTNRTLYLELYPELFTNDLKLLGGLAQVKDGNSILFQGNMSLTSKTSD